jgi:hypothetical protein
MNHNCTTFTIQDLEFAETASDQQINGGTTIMRSPVIFEIYVDQYGNVICGKYPGPTTPPPVKGPIKSAF